MDYLIAIMAVFTYFAYFALMVFIFLEIMILLNTVFLGHAILFIHPALNISKVYINP